MDGDLVQWSVHDWVSYWSATGALTHVAMETIASPMTDASRIRVASCSLIAIRMVTAVRSTTTFERMDSPSDRVVDGVGRDLTR